MSRMVRQTSSKRSQKAKKQGWLQDHGFLTKTEVRYQRKQRRRIEEERKRLRAFD